MYVILKRGVFWVNVASPVVDVTRYCAVRHDEGSRLEMKTAVVTSWLCSPK